MTATDRQAPRDIRSRRRAELIATVQRIAVGRFAAQGFEATTLNEVCGDAGISLRTFFRHFESKEDLLWAVGRDLRRAIHEHLAQRAAGTTFPEAMADAVACAYDRLYHDDRDYARDCQQLLSTTPVLAALQQVDATSAEPTDAEREFAESADLDPADPRTRLLLGYVAIAVDHAVNAWAGGTDTTLRAAVLRNLNLIRWP